MNKIQITQEGLKGLQNELDELINIKLPDLLVRLQEARAMGDLRENSQYSAAKEEQRMMDGRIFELQQIIEHAEIVDTEANSGVVAVGSHVVVSVDGKTDTYYIVGDYEADPMNKKLSQSSPIGKALMGKQIGQTVDVQVPAGAMVFKIVEIK